MCMSSTTPKYDINLIIHFMTFIFFSPKDPADLQKRSADGFKSVFSSQYFWLLSEYQWLEVQFFSAASLFILLDLVLFQHFVIFA